MIFRHNQGIQFLIVLQIDIRNAFTQNFRIVNLLKSIKGIT